MKLFPSNQTTHSECHFVVTCFFAIFMGFGYCHKAAAETFFLLDETSSQQGFAVQAPPSLPTGFPASNRSRHVTVTPSVADGKGIGLGDTLVLNLFDDTVFSAVIDRVSTNLNGTSMIRGRLEAYSFSEFIISTTNGRSLISIRIPETGKHYLIQSEPRDKQHYILELDTDNLDALEDAPAPIPPEEDLTKQILGAMDTASNDPLDTVNIDVMIVYTPAAKTWANTSGGGIINVIAQAMQKAELVLANSETILTMALVHSSEVNYTESGDSGTDLDRLTWTTDGYVDEVHTLRDNYGADLVAMFTVPNDTAGGIGWVLSSASGRPAYGFSITRVQQASLTYTTIHELGHNMGCGHHKDQNFQPGPGLFSYSAGWRWTGSDSGKYCSVMTYEGGQYFADGISHTRMAYFANPSLYYMGTPTGHATDGDNARNIRETKDVVSAYRDPPEPPVAQTSSVAVPMDTPTTITLQATDDGLPNPPAALNYTITSLPQRGILTDPQASEITGVPYTLVNDQDEVMFTSDPNCGLPVEFTFIANDYGTAPGGGDSNEVTVTIAVEVGSEVIYSANMDTDPNWTFDGSYWEWGTPTGNGGSSGNPDPTSGHTEPNVIGYNRTGDYPNNLSTTEWATTPAVDCNDYTNVTLEFYRWLGVERALYDHAYIAVSNNGSSWTIIWENPNNPSITDSSWAWQSYDISAVADNQPTVYIRWGMGETDNSVTYAGWNIDDVEVLGTPLFIPLTGDFEPDCDVDFDDLGLLISYWLQSCGDCQGTDLLADGIINLKDYALLAQNWLIQ